MDELKEPGDELPEGPSKSQIKRELHALQDLAERLVSMPRAELERFSLSRATWEAIDESVRIRDHRALRRHYKRIAKLLAREDGAALRVLVNEEDRLRQEAASRHHKVERWRQRLVQEGDAALGDLLDEYPAVDRQQLRTLIRSAQRDRDRDKPDASRKLFRFLRSAFDQAPPGSDE